MYRISPNASPTRSYVAAVDHLAVWQQVREQIAWPEIVPEMTGPVRAVRNGFSTYAHRTVDRGTQRMRRLLAAQAEVQRTVAGGVPLSPKLLADWNRVILGAPVAGFRRGPAYAKEGRERYGLVADTPQRFAACLVQAGDAAVPVVARAARAYLDVAFFHPYDDGNARLAALVLQFLLHREQIELDDVLPILATVRRADDAEGAVALARMIHGMAVASHHRWHKEQVPTGTSGWSAHADAQQHGE